VSELHWLSLEEAAARIAAGDLTPTELTRALLERIEQLDAELGSYALVCGERALEAARRAEIALARGEVAGPLHGVPVAVKDLCDARGLASAAGMPVLRERVPEGDSAVVERLESAGALLLGKLQMTEGASATHHPEVEPPLNPWDRAASPGGSSSGSGAAVAAGLCFGALGSDTAGSIRIPSAYCGVVGLKPTWGRVSRRGIFPLAPSLDTVGPMARRVRDVARMLGVLAGPDAGDPTAAREPVPDYATAATPGLHGVRIGYDGAYATGNVDAQLAGAVAASLDVLRNLGAELREVTLPDVEEAMDALGPIFHAEVAHAHAELLSKHAERYGPHLRELIERGQQVTGTAYSAAHECRLRFRGRLRALFDSIDLLLCPPMVGPAPPAELVRSIPGDFNLLRPMLRFTGPFNVAGVPTLTLPCGFSDAGLPLALQLVGRHFEEALLARVGAAYEGATEWHRRRPPLEGREG
jgi:amidase